MKTILTDIMGTTTPNAFVQELMQDFKQNGAIYIDSDTSSDTIKKVKNQSNLTTGKEIVDFIFSQYELGNKQPNFYTIIGMVNNNGYQNNRLTTPLFQDVLTSFKKWKNQGKNIFVYSQGRNKELQSMFENTTFGDISKYITTFFGSYDIGFKDNPDSYKRIADNIKSDTKNILFLSDLEKELDAASKAGYDTRLVVRPQNKPLSNPDGYTIISSFNEI